MLAFRGEEDIAFREAGCFDRSRDVEDVVALGNGKGLGVDVALDEASIDIGCGDRVVEAVFAGFEGSSAGETEKVKAVSTADDSVLLHEGGDGRGTGACRDVDEGLGRGAVGGVDDVGGCPGGDEKKQQDNPKELQSCASA